MKKPIVILSGAILLLIVGVWSNPFAWNSAGQRTVIEQMSGNQFVRFKPGMYYAGFFSKSDPYPNQFSISYQDSIPDLELRDNAVEIGLISIQFGLDATTAKVSGIAQFFLPTDEKEMIALHNAHRSLISLVTKRIAPYTKECLKSAAQLMSSEQHYSGGRSQLAQDYIDQLNYGSYLLRTNETFVYDSTTQERKKVYLVEIRRDKNGEAQRKFSSLKEYGITVADAQITDVDYQPLVREMLQKKIASSTNASVSKQELITAQQRALTAKAQGEQKLVEIEYAQKQEQTKQVVAAQTLVKLAEQDRDKQKIAVDASLLEARKIKTLADAHAYEKQTAMHANGALEQKLAAYIEVQKAWASAASQSQWVPTYNMGGAANGAANVTNMVDIMTAKLLRDLNVDMSNKK